MVIYYKMQVCCSKMGPYMGPCRAHIGNIMAPYVGQLCIVVILTRWLRWNAAFLAFGIFIYISSLPVRAVGVANDRRREVRACAIVCRSVSWRVTQSNIPLRGTCVAIAKNMRRASQCASVHGPIAWETREICHACRAFPYFVVVALPCDGVIQVKGAARWALVLLACVSTSQCF
jgi:hypothetical protein